MSYTARYDFTAEQLVFFVTDEGMGDLVARIGRIARITISIVKGKEETAYEVATASGSVYFPDWKDVFQADRNYVVEEMASRIRRDFDAHEDAMREAAIKDAASRARENNLADRLHDDLIIEGSFQKDINESPKPCNEVLSDEVPYVAWQSNAEGPTQEVEELISGAAEEDPGEENEFEHDPGHREARIDRD